MGSLVKVKVDQADIDRAIRDHSMKCVVVQALARTIPDAHHIDVDVATIRWTVDGERFCYLTPYTVQGYVVAFDAGDEIHPFSFQLDARSRVPIRQRKRTDSGLAVHNAQEEVRRAKKEQKATEKTGSPVEVTRAKTKVVRAQGRLESVTAAYKGQKQQVNVGPSGRKPPPRVSRTSRRSYGHRAMRINQQPRRLVKKRAIPVADAV
jgi:hypothetical protein